MHSSKNVLHDDGDDDPDVQILNLQKALELSLFKNKAQMTALENLKKDMKGIQKQLQDERQEHKRILSKKNITRLQNDLMLERTQRLQDLRLVQKKGFEVHALAKETSIATENALLAQNEAAGNRTEIICLEKTLQVSTKLLNRADLDYKSVHQELEQTRIRLIDARTKHSQKSEELREWIDRYHQVMVDLNVAQMKLAQQSTTSSAKQQALMRGYEIVLQENGGAPIQLVPRQFHNTKPIPTAPLHNGSRNDMALYQSKTISHRAMNPASFPTIAEAVRKEDRSDTEAGGKVRMSKDKKNRKARKGDNNRVLQSDSIRSKYVGYGLGMLKKDPMHN